MSIKQRYGSWYIDFRFQGERIRKKSPVNSSAGAKNYESMLRQKLLSGENIANDFDIELEKTYKEYAWMWFEKYALANNKYSEIKMKEYILNTHLVPHFGKTKLNKITTFQVEQYKTCKLKKGLTKKTINNQLAVLSKSLKTAGEWFELDPIPKVQLFKVRYNERKFLTKDEAQLFLQASSNVWYEMGLTALHTGLRLGELIGLRWEDIDYKQNLLTVRRAIVRNKVGTPKNGKTRIIPLSAPLARMFKSRQSRGYVFTSRPGLPLSTNNCSLNISKICDKAKLERFGWHTLRHTATQLASNNVPIISIKELMGHSDIKTTMRYAHLIPSTLREAIQTFETENNFGHHVDTALQNKDCIVNLNKILNPALVAKIKENKPESDLFSN
jgi:integrase